MAKNFVTGAARGPSNEEFQKRVARLAATPVQAPLPKERRNKFAKSAHKPLQPEQPSEGSEQSSDRED